MLVIGTEIHNMPVGIAYRVDTDLTASDLDLHCLCRPFWQAAI